MTKDEALKLALESLENINTWLHARGSTMREIRKVLAQPEQVTHTVIAGALFDFMGYLTSRRKRIVLSAFDDAAPAANALEDFAKKRGLSLDDAQVREWRDALALPDPVLAEREACAVVCEKEAADWERNAWTDSADVRYACKSDASHGCAEAIRARSHT